MNKLKNLLLATTVVTGLSVSAQESKETQEINKDTTTSFVVEKHSAKLGDTLTLQEKYNAVVADLESRAVADPRYNQKFVIQKRPADQFVVDVATSKNIFFADPQMLQILSEEPLDNSTFADKGYTVEKSGTDVYLIKFDGDINLVKQDIENWAKPKQYIKTTEIRTDDSKETPDYVFNISYPSVEYVTNVELEACPTWTDPQANWTNLSGTSALWLSDTPWVMNGMNNVPVVGLDKIQSFQYLVSGNDVNFNIIDAGYNDTTEINTVYKYNTAEEQTAHVAENHGTSTVSLGAGKINGLYGVGTNPWAKVRAIDAGVNSGLIVTDVQEGFDLLNTQIATTPNNAQVLNCSFSGANSAIWQAKVATFATNTAGKGMIVVSAGNTGNSTMNPLAEVPYTVGIGAVNSQSNTRAKWSGSSWGGTLSDPRHVFAMADGNNTGVPNVSWVFAQGNGTSYASPLAAGQMSTYQMFFPNHTNAQIQEAFANTAYDLQTAGHDIQTGYGYLQAHKALVYGSSMSLPSTVDAGSNGAYSFQFTPETLNDATLASQILLYPNGLPVPYTVGGDGKRTYTIAVNTNNGFVNGANSLTYTVVAPAPYAGCTLSGATKKITVSNVATLSVEEFAQQSPSIAIAPNPVNDILTFKSNKTIKKAEVYSIDGKLLDHDMNLMDNKLDLSHIANGMVIVVFVADDSTSTQVKVLINHNQR